MDSFENIAYMSMDMQKLVDNLREATSSSSKWSDDVQEKLNSIAYDICQCVEEISHQIKPISGMSKDICSMPFEDECKIAGSNLEKAKSVANEANKIVSGN